MEKLNDRWIKLIGIPAVEFGTNLFYLESYHYDWLVYFRTSFFGLVYIYLMWELVTRWLIRARALYPRIEQTRRRVLVTFAGYLVIVTVGQLSVVWLFGIIGLAGVPITSDVYVSQLLGGYLVVMVVGAVYEITYYFSKLKIAIIEAEIAQKAQLQHQFDNLKAQINPHFLFNSLNSLGALIGENPRQATAFLDEMSSVYRYLLQTGDRELIPLRQELSFIKSYYHLLKTRYGSAIALYREVDDALLDAQLPPLTLQLLVENAVKHNAILPENPLIISLLTTEMGELVVANTIHRKSGGSGQHRLPESPAGPGRTRHRRRWPVFHRASAAGREGNSGERLAFIGCPP